MACHLKIAKDGTLKTWRFTRAKVRIAANIAYEDAQAAIDAAGEERIEVARRPARCRRSKDAVPQRAGREGAEAAVGLLARAVRGAAEARSARARPARAAGDARREGAHHLDRAARPARRAPAGRGLYDRRQCRRGARARGEEGAGHVPRPRAAEPREAGRAQGLSEDLRHRVRARPGDQARHLQPHHRAGRRRRGPRGDHGADCCAPRCRRATRPSGSAISGWRSRPTRISPRRSAAMPTCSSTARWSALTGSATAGCRRARRSGSSRSASRSRCSSGARWRPSARLSTAMSPPILADQVGQLVECRITGVQPFGFFADGRGSRRRRAGAREGPRPRIFPLRRGGASSWSATRAARPTASASG